MYKIFITLSVALLVCGLSNGWPFSGGAADEGNPCVDVLINSERKCRKMVAMRYENSTMVKKVMDMEKKIDIDSLMMSWMKVRCCFDDAVFECIEKDVKVI